MSAPGEGPIRVTVPRDGMQAALTLLAGAPDARPTVEDCLATLRDREVIVDDAVEASVRELVERHAADPSIDREAVVAEGVAPVHGEDGRFELEPAFAAPPDAPLEADAEEQVDYYARSTFHLVGAGQRIGRVIEPVPGVAGRTVQGKPVNARTGRPCDLALDDTVERRGDAVVALVAGALRCSGKAVGVQRTLEIKGDVDYATGNLRFPGDIAVGGCVRDCFTVEAEGDITIRGVVEAASITAQRDAHLLGGMAGREKGALVAGRDLTARYLGMVTGVIGRDASVEREVVDCDLEVRGRFFGERCAIVGGRLAVSASADIGEVGRDSGVRTEIVLGRIPRAERLASRAAGMLRSLQEREEQARAGAAPDDGESVSGLLDRLNQALGRLHERLGPRAEVRLSVQRQIHRGAVIVAGDYELVLTHTVRGPVRLTLDLGGLPRMVQASTNSELEMASYARVRALRTRPGDQAA